jgi:hypothetical protein
MRLPASFGDDMVIEGETIKSWIDEPGNAEHQLGS